MRQYRPTIEELKKRYSMELARKRRGNDSNEVRIPLISQSWLPHLPKSVAECAWISQQILASIEESKARLPECIPVEGFGMMRRYADAEVLSFALGNPHAEVRDYALKVLHEFEAEGDPYSRDILAAWRQRTV